MNLVQVKAHFDGEAPEYDAIVRACIPYYEAQNETLALLTPFETGQTLSFLDLGAGTGVLTEMLLRKYPRANALVFDFASHMQDESRRRLAPFSDRVRYALGDFEEDDFGQGYDLVVSGLAIHHLEDEAKRSLYARIFSALNPGGVLLVRDIVLGATKTLTEQYIDAWMNFIRRNGMDDADLLAKYYREDIPAPVLPQLTWLMEAGFMDIDCHWRYLNFAIFGGRKPFS